MADAERPRALCTLSQDGCHVVQVQVLELYKSKGSFEGDTERIRKRITGFMAQIINYI